MIALDDDIGDHPKFVGLSDEAFGLWVRCIGYCRRNRTDGYIPEQAALQRCRARSPRKVIAELTGKPAGAPEANPLWTKVLGGYQVHDYLDWNPSREQVLAKVEAKRQAGRVGGRRSGEARRQQRPEQIRSEDEAPCFDSGSTKSNPDPIRSGSDPRSISDPISLPPLTGRGAREAAAAAAHDPVTAAIIAQLGQTAKLRHLATAEFAARIAPHCDQHPALGKHTLAEILESIREADSKILDQEAGGELFDQGRISALVIGFVKRGRKPPVTRGPPPPSRVQPGEGRAWTSNPKEF